MTLLVQAGLDSISLARLDELLIERICRAGETVQASGAYTDTLYLVVEGTVDVFADDSQVASLTAGDVFGEKQLLEPGPATHALRATKRARLKSLDGPAFDQFAHEFPQSAFALQAVLARRVLQELKRTQENLNKLFETFKAS